jgi:hypothetical protein
MYLMPNPDSYMTLTTYPRRLSRNKNSSRKPRLPPIPHQEVVLKGRVRITLSPLGVVEEVREGFPLVDKQSIITKPLPIAVPPTQMQIMEEEPNVGNSPLIPEGTPIWARLRCCISEWKLITLNKTVLAYIEFGVPYRFTSPPPPKFVPEMILSAEHSAARDSELSRLVDIQALVPLPSSEFSQAVFAGVFMVPKPNSDKFRPVIDQTYTNSFVDKVHFKMETIKDVKDIMMQDDWLLRWDLKDAYLHAGYRSSHRRFGATMWKGRAWCFASMMFGYSDAPRLWTKIFNPVVVYLRKKGIRCVIYLDDLLVLVQGSYQDAVHVREMVDDLLIRLGFTISLEKSARIPRKHTIYLGFILDSVKMIISVVSPKIKLLRQDCRKLLATRVATPRQLAKILGKISSMAQAILPWRLRSRALLVCKDSALRARIPWDSQISISFDALQELIFWTDQIKIWNGKPLKTPTPDWTLTTDASGTGFGGTGPDFITANAWEDLENNHSTRLETLAADRVVREFVLDHSLQNGTLLHQSDNTTTVSYINHQGGRVRDLSQITEGLWTFCLQHGITLVSQWVPGDSIPHEDFLSRILLKDSELSLPQEIFRIILNSWGPFQMDLFATRFNNQMDSFASLYQDPKASVKDAFSFPWKGRMYAFPPFNQIGRCLAKVLNDRTELVLVVPDWPGATWTPLIQKMALEPPLPLGKTLLNLKKEERVIKWELIAFLVSGNLSMNEVFPTKL